jgi:hypothetical protein
MIKKPELTYINVWEFVYQTSVWNFILSELKKIWMYLNMLDINDRE